MADLISRLKLESGEFDSKIKRAGQELLAYSEHCKKMGLQMGYANADAKKFAAALGSMTTTAQSTRGKLNELTQAFTDLSVMYKNMTNEEKNSTFGKNLAASLDQLKTRINDTKAQLNDVSVELGNTKQAGGDTGGMLDHLTSKFGISIDKVVGWGTAIGAAKVALDVAKDAFMSSEGNIDEWGRTVEGAKGAYDVFLQTINNGNWSSFFSNLNNAINGARDLYNALDRLGSIKSNNQAAIAIQQQQVQQLRLMKQQGKNVDDQLKAATERLATLQKQSVDAGKRAGSAMVGQTIRNGYQSQQGAGKLSGGTVDAVVNDIMKNGQKAFDKYAKMVADLEKKGTSTRHSNYGGSEVTYKTFDINNLTAEQQKQYRLAKTITERETEIQKGITLYAQAVNEGAAAAREQLKGNKYAMAGSGKGGNKKDTKEQTELQQNQKKINDLTQQYVDLSKQGLTSDDERLVKLREEIKELEKRNGLLNLRSEQAQGRLLLKADDINKTGINRAPFGGLLPGPDTKKPGMLDDKAMKSVEKNIKKQTDLQAKELKESKKEDKSLSTGIDNLAGGMTSVVGGLEQLGVEIPDGFKNAISAMQGISSILTGIAATVLAIEAIAGADAIIPFANGGVVHAAGGFSIPGNRYSGDLVPAFLNSGELVLNRAQQGVLASELSGSGMQNMKLDTIIRGEDIRLVLNNNGRRTGRGEYVQTNRR